MTQTTPSIINNEKLSRFGSQLNQSLIHGIEVLQGVASSNEPIAGRELSRLLELDITKVNRMLRTLAYLGLVRQTSDRKYTSGPGMHVLAAQSLYGAGFIQNAIKPLESLKDFGLIVAMGVLWQNKVTYLYHALPGMDSMDAIGRMSYYPATLSGVGLSLLSQLSDDEIVHLYKGKTIEGFDDCFASLMDKIEEIRRNKFTRVETTNKKLKNSKTYTIAVNVGTPVYSSIALSGWIPEDSTDELVEILHQKANEIVSAIE
ncbi:helix-turn-helix domain-containing protein [Shewanella sp. 202IG2-18]|uniref:helix-turn-helix domain-containing protein n=1 Tax=Parashewanella hymeniacidonis TaxID=2807618 RepID=UPI0019621406|nr:helix-turn-helix domain-containing protein [Parashewanella hymeniacidonis]MBM7072702.1 helix-turn-helix domain-containing protein [Parashewanella hymeniacidonis]